MRSMLDKAVTLYRLTPYSTGEKFTLVGTIYACIVPANMEDVALYDGVPATSHRITCDAATNIAAGDKLVWNSRTFLVRAVRQFDMRAVSRLECFVYEPAA